MHSGFGRFILRRAAFAALLVFVVSSASLVLARLAPPDDAFGTDPATLAAERHRAGFDKPLPQQYADWLSRIVRLDFGESLRFRRPVAELIRERAGEHRAARSFRAHACDARRHPARRVHRQPPRRILVSAARGASLALLSVPPLVTSLVLLLLAARTGWFPAGGLRTCPRDAGWLESAATTARYLFLPALALSLPIAASLERLQSRSLSEALAEPCVVAAIARGIPRPARGLETRAPPVAQAGPRDLRHHDRQRPQRILRGRNRDVVAGPWRPDVPGAPGARSLSRRGMRRRGILRPGPRDPPVGPGARRGRSPGRGAGVMSRGVRAGMVLLAAIAL